MKKLSRASPVITWGRQSFVPVLISLLLGAIYLLGSDIQELLIYRRSAVEQGETWRLVTAHLVHKNDMHLLFNIIGFIVVHLCWLVAGVSPIRAVLLLLFTILNTSLLVHYWITDIQGFMGLSAILHGNWLIAAWLLWQRFRLEASLLAGLLLLKLLIEQIVGQMPYSDLFGSLRVEEDGHLYGALGGVATILIWQTWQYLEVEN